MDIPTKKLSEYIINKGINLTNLSNRLNISYQSLSDSLSKANRGRNLRAGEYLAICKFLELDPMSLCEKRK